APRARSPGPLVPTRARARWSPPALPPSWSRRHCASDDGASRHCSWRSRGHADRDGAREGGTDDSTNVLAVAVEGEEDQCPVSSGCTERRPPPWIVHELEHGCG